MEDGSSEPSAGFIDATSLPSTASYTLFVDPYGAATGSVTLTVYDVRPDFSGTITAAAQPQAVTVEIDAPGQNGSLTFSGTAGQHVALKAATRSRARSAWAVT